MKPNDVMPVPCTTWAEKLAAQPADLTTEERAALAGHILTCPACASVQAAYRAMDAAILALPPVVELADLPHLDGVKQESQSTEDRHKAPTSTTQPPPVPTGRGGRGGMHSRRWVRLVSGVTAVLVVGVLLAGFLFLFNGHHTFIGGVAGAQAIFTASDSDGTVYAVRPGDGALYWQHSTGQKLTGALVASNDTVFAGSYAGHVYALDKSDGALRWSSQYIPGGVFPPMFTDGTALYFSSPDAIYAMRASNGQILWHRAKPVCNTCSSAYTAAFAAVSDGIAYAYLDGLYALRASDGRVLWHHPEYQFTTSSFVALAGEVFVPGDHDGRVYELRASDGHLLHTFAFAPDDLLEMVSSGDTIYIDSAGHDLYAIRSSDDSIIWHKQFSDFLGGLAAAHDGTLYFASTTIAAISIGVTSEGSTPTPTVLTGTPSSEVDAVNASDGSLRWRWQPASNSGDSTDVLAIGNATYLAVGNTLYALSVKDGTVLWTISEGSSLETPFAA